MYSSTPSLSLSTASSSALAKSVLAQFPPDAAHSVVTAVVKSVSNQLGIGVVIPGVHTATTTPTMGSSNPPSATSSMLPTAKSSGRGFVAEGPTLKNEAQITWFMEVRKNSQTGKQAKAWLVPRYLDINTGSALRRKKVSWRSQLVAGNSLL